MYFGILGSIIIRLRMMNLSLLIDMKYFHFGPSISGIYILVPKLKTNYSSVSDLFLDKTKGGLWVKFQYSYVFIVWLSNFGNITFWSMFLENCRFNL